MERILLDYYAKETKHIWGDDPNTPFNQQIVAVNNMYGWLYEQGILRGASFKFKDYSDMSYFALDVKDLEPYREQMVKSGVEGAELAVQHIFDEKYTPCLYSGAFQLGWTMMTYRDFDGTVSRSWECGVVQGLASHTVLDVEEIKNTQGIQAAVAQAFDWYDLEPDLFDQACEYYKDWVEIDDVDGDRDFLYNYADKLIYCYQHGKDLIDFDFWVRYEELVGDKITYDEYLVIDGQFDGDPHDVELTDTETISEFKKHLVEHRDGAVRSLEASINEATEEKGRQCSAVVRDNDLMR